MTAYTEEIREALPHEELLGTLILYPKLFQEYQQQLDIQMFFDYEWLFKQMKIIEKEEGLSLRGLITRSEVQQIETIKELKNAAFSEKRIPELIRKCKNILLTDKLRKLSRQILESCGNEEADEILRKVQKETESLFTSSTGVLRDMIKEVDDYAERIIEISNNPAKAYGVLTNIRELDNMTTGWHKKDFSVIGARTSMGKSAFMIENLLRLNKQGYKVALFSLEMSADQIRNRMMCNIIQANFEKYRLGQLSKYEYGEMAKHKPEINTIYIDDSRGVDAEYIADVMKQLKRKQGLDFVAVDYLQDIKERGENNDNQGSALGRVCRKLRKAAQDCDCHIMGLSQVVRGVEDRQDKRPGNSDLSGSTGIETSADVIGILYRDDYYNPNTDKKGILEVNFTKQRNGKTGKVELKYDRTTQRISSPY